MLYDYDAVCEVLKLALDAVLEAKRSIGHAHGVAYPTLVTQKKLTDAVCLLLEVYIITVACNPEALLDPNLPFDFHEAFKRYVGECFSKAEHAIATGNTKL